MDHHLDKDKEDGRLNSRNGYGRKSVFTETGKIDLDIPRDRLATFDPHPALSQDKDVFGPRRPLRELAELAKLNASKEQPRFPSEARRLLRALSGFQAKAGAP
jgi:hypothetical protein